MFKLKEKAVQAEIILHLILAGILLMGFIMPNSGYAQRLSGSISHRYSYDLNTGGTWDALSRLDLELEHRFPAGSLYLNPLITYSSKDGEADAEFEELYLDLYTANWDFRLGRQHINLGQADGLVVTNILTPRDLTAYPVIDFDEQFRSIDALRASRFWGLNTLDLVWIPEFRAMEVDESFYHRFQKQMPAFPRAEMDSSDKYPASGLENGEFALRYSTLGSDLDYELIAGYLWDSEPVMHIVKEGAHTVIEPRHHRIGVLGGSSSTTRGGVVFRGEGLYTLGKHFNAFGAEYEDQTVEKDQLTWLLGVDTDWQEYFLSAQLYQDIILDYEEGIMQDEVSSIMTLLIERTFLRETLRTGLFLRYQIVPNDLTANASVSYDYSDEINFDFGINKTTDEGLYPDLAFMQIEYLF